MEIVVMVVAGYAAAAAALRLVPHLVTRRPVVLAVVVGAAVMATLAPARATGWVPLDVILLAAFGAGCAFGASRGPRVATWTAAVTAAAVAVSGADVEYAAAGVGVALAVHLVGMPAPGLLAVAGGLSAQALVRLDWPVATGASLVAGVIAAAPVLIVAMTATPARGRRWVGGAIALAVGVCLVGGGAGGAAALSARSDVDRGVQAALDGLEALGSDDQDGARESLEAAAAAFREADDRLRAPWARPALAVPIVAQHARAVATMANAGAELAETAVATLDEADPDAVRSIGGRIDLDAVERLAAPLQAALASLVRADERLADVDSPWLVTPVAERRDELGRRVAAAREGAEVAAEAARLAPSLLGGEEPRRYLIAVFTPSESMASGGFLGNFGELTVDDGELSLTRFGRNAELSDGGPDPDGRELEGQREFQRRYGAFDPQRAWGLIALSPDFPTVADVMAQLYPQSGGDEIDGVIGVDPHGIAALMEVTGPIDVDGWPEPLTSDNAARILLHEQYLAFETDPRVDFLGAAANALFGRLTAAELPGPTRIAGVLSPAVRGRHLQLASVHQDEQRFFERIGAAGSVPPVRGDTFGLVGQNYNGNKIDWFLHRRASYTVEWDPGTGSVRGELELRLRNDAPASGLPRSVIGWGGDSSRGQVPVADGENLMLLQLYTTGVLSEITVDGEPVETGTDVELGRNVTIFPVRVPAQSTVVVRATVDGAVDEGDRYHFESFLQPMVNADELELRVSVPDAWQLDRAVGLDLTDPGRAEVVWTLDEPRQATLHAEPRSADLLEKLRGERG